MGQRQRYTRAGGAEPGQRLGRQVHRVAERRQREGVGGAGLQPLDGLRQRLQRGDAEHRNRRSVQERGIEEQRPRPGLGVEHRQPAARLGVHHRRADLDGGGVGRGLHHEDRAFRIFQARADHPPALGPGGQVTERRVFGQADGDRTGGNHGRAAAKGQDAIHPGLAGHVHAVGHAGHRAVRRDAVEDEVVDAGQRALQPRQPLRIPRQCRPAADQHARNAFPDHDIGKPVQTFGAGKDPNGRKGMGVGRFGHCSQLYC